MLITRNLWDSLLSQRGDFYDSLNGREKRRYATAASYEDAEKKLEE